MTSSLSKLLHTSNIEFITKLCVLTYYNLLIKSIEIVWKIEFQYIGYISKIVNEKFAFVKCKSNSNRYLLPYTQLEQMLRPFSDRGD